MARKIKQITFDFLTEEIEEKNNKVVKKTINDNVHFDNEDNTLAEKHFGKYLMTTLSDIQSNTSSRVYLSYNYKKEYYVAKLYEGNTFYNKKPSRNVAEIFDGNEKYKKLIENIIDVVFIEKYTNNKTISILAGCRIFINLLKKKEYLINNISELQTEHFVYALENIESYKDFKYLDYFFRSIKFNPNEDIRLKYRKKLKPKNKKTDAIPSSILFQLEKAVLAEFKVLKDIESTYKNWLIDFNDINFITKEDLLKTVFDFIESTNKYVENTFITTPNKYINKLSLF